MKDKPRILFYLIHLLGIGHLQRILAVTDELLHAGAEVCILSTGGPATILQQSRATVFTLPTVSIRDHDFSTLYSISGGAMSASDWGRRIRAIDTQLRSFRPQVLVTEMYPFGRRKFHREIRQMLESAAGLNPPPVVVASVRDIIQGNRKDDHYREMARVVRDCYDHVLVHGDPVFIPFDLSFPYTDDVANRISYTGYVSGNRPVSSMVAEPVDVLVSTGGSEVGERLIRCCLDVSRQPLMANYRWCIRTSLWAKIHATQTIPSHVRVEALDDDFIALLGQARISISQGGYNTMVDLLQSHTPAVVVPFEGSGETEQRQRAEKLSVDGQLVVLLENDLDAESLLVAMQRAGTLDTGKRLRPMVDGARQSADRLLQWANLS